jgi:rhodanese-related sulfurtransferase
MEEIKGLNQPLILCCASGNRSGNAQGYLAQNGIDCVNGGPWFEVEYLLNQAK